MSLQIFLQSKILGIEEFLLAPGPPACAEDWLLLGRSRWVTLLSEVLPRALLAELGLSRMLLGSSGGGQFLLVLPMESRPQAEDFLKAAARDIDQISGGPLKLVWAVTENLGDWSIVRRRLNEEMQRKRGTPAAGGPSGLFAPFDGETEADTSDYFCRQLGAELQEAQSVGWSPESPGKVLPGEGKHSWTLGASASGEGIPLARHAARDEDGKTPAGVAVLAGRAGGRRTWGVLRGDVDNLEIRLRRVATIEDHVQLSVMYKQFFANELELLCSLPEFWQKVTILYAGGDDFAVFGAWDALIPLAREIQRLFHRFCDENLADFPGPEGKTITMAISLAAERDSPFASVYEDAGQKLELAKSADKDCIYVLGRTLEWRQLATASDLRDTLSEVAEELGSPSRLLWELGGFYRESADVAGPEVYLARPWRVHQRFSRAFGDARGKGHQKLRTQLTNEMVAKGIRHMKLRPGGRVALAWTKLLEEG